MYCPTASAKHRRSLGLAGSGLVFFPLIKALALPLGGRDLGLGLEPWWKRRRGWKKPEEVMAVPYRV